MSPQLLKSLLIVSIAILAGILLLPAAIVAGISYGLTMAAREGKDMSASDEEGALDDLAQLEALESEDPEASNE